jgi:hypothetical protein
VLGSEPQKPDLNVVYTWFVSETAAAFEHTDTQRALFEQQQQQQKVHLLVGKLTGLSLVAWRFTPTDAWLERHVLLDVWRCAVAAVTAAAQLPFESKGYSCLPLAGFRWDLSCCSCCCWRWWMNPTNSSSDTVCLWLGI